MTDGVAGIDNELFERAIAAEKRRARRTGLIGIVLAAALLSPVGYFLAGLAHFDATTRKLAAPAISLALVLVGVLVVRLVQWFSSSVVTSIVEPGGQARGPVAHSKAEALAAQGRLEEASTEFEAARAASGGGSIASLRAEAELHASASGDPRRAEDLFQRIRRAPDASANDELYASHRLIDLYLGALNDPGRVMVELRRMADRFPDTIDGQSALAELKRRRDEQLES